VRELAVGLSRLSAAERSGLRLLGLTRLELDGTFQVTEDLSSFAGSPEIPLPTARDHYRWAYARRLALFLAAKRLGAEAVHLGDPHATPWLMPLTSCRRIVTCHDAIPMHFPQRYMGWRDGGPWLGAAIERHRYRSADLVVAISDATLRDVLMIHGVPKHRAVRVYNGVDVDYWAREPSIAPSEVLAKFGLHPREFAFYVGGYHWHKNVEGMLGGVARARAQGCALKLVWAGQLSTERQAAIRALASNLGVNDAVRFIGYVTDAEVNVLYRSAVAHTLLSRYEGFGLTVVEAMASGSPVITTAEGSLAEIAGDAAITVDPDDCEAIGAALTRLQRDDSFRQEFITRGKKRAPRFSLDVQAKAMMLVYCRFLDDSR